MVGLRLSKKGWTKYVFVEYSSPFGMVQEVVFVWALKLKLSREMTGNLRGRGGISKKHSGEARIAENNLPR